MSGIKHFLNSVFMAMLATRHAEPWLAHWKQLPAEANLSRIVQQLEGMLTTTETEVEIKGHPKSNAIRRDAAAVTLAHLRKGNREAALESAHRCATCDMRDGEAFEIYVGLLLLFNKNAIESLRSAVKGRVVVHVSCLPRVGRAMESCKSFVACTSDGSFAQIIVIANEQPWFDFSADSMVLTVPGADSYEALPRKVVAAFAFLALCGTVEFALKVDDDHRLASAASLQLAATGMKSSRATQSGVLLDFPALGSSPRVWHFGKTTDQARGARPYTLPGTTRFLCGGNGYMLNGKALLLMFWSYVYFPDYLDANLYEDVTVSDLLERQGGRLVHFDMNSVLTTVGGY